MATSFENECFFIAPIGEAGSETRKRSDAVRDRVVKPAAEAASALQTVRGDDVGKPGQITESIIEHCLNAKAAVADLTGASPNVYYELSMRHTAGLPVVLIAEEGTKIPLNINHPVIFFSHTDSESARMAKEQLQLQIEASVVKAPGKPMADADEIEMVFEPQEEGGFHVYVPDFPGLHTQGDSFDEAMANANEAVALYIEGLREDGESLDSGVIRRTIPVPA
jgi:predicted RNase H-like HicB family nuclease